MKITVITWNGSDYGYRFLNCAYRQGLQIENVVAIELTIPKLLQLYNKMFIKRIGYLDGLYFGCKRFIGEFLARWSATWDGKPLIRDYERLSKHHIIVSNLSDDRVVELVRNLNTDVLVLAQSGIVPEVILNSAKHRALNAHCGWLPEYRGNHVLYWTCYNKEFDKIGYSIHEVTPSIDNGPILHRKRVKPNPGETIERLQSRLYELQIKALVDLCLCLNENSAQALDLDQQENKLYFAMPLPKRRQAEENLRRYLFQKH